MKKIFLVFLICFAYFNFGCDNSVDIVSEYEERLVVFLVLDNRSDKQILKVQKLQNSFGLPVLEKLTGKISASLVHPEGYSIPFKDTVMNTVPNFNTLYVDNLKFVPGLYQLLITTEDSLHAWSSITLAPSADIICSFDSIAYSVRLQTVHSIRGAHIKPYLLYRIRQNSEYVEKSIEVPIIFNVDKNDTLEIFSGLIKILGNEKAKHHLQLPLSSIQYTKNKLTNRFGAANIQFDKINFVSYAYDWELYEYINFHEGYFDDYSIRLDRPNYTNITAGTSIFGAVLVDSAFYNLY